MMRNLKYCCLIGALSGILCLSGISTPCTASAKNSADISKLLLVTSDKTVFMFKEKSLKGDVTGMLDKGDSAHILKTYDNYYYIKSGKYKGYISKDNVICGKKAEKKAVTLCKQNAVTDNQTVFIYNEPDTNSSVITTCGTDNSFEIKEKKNNWYKIKTDLGIEGYVEADNIDRQTVYTSAKEPDIELYSELYPEKALATYEDDADYDSSQNDNSNNNYDLPSDTSLGQQIADYACQFVGNPYVWGGVSLTNGCDCSGFVMKVYEHFGYIIPHSSYSQRSCGKEVCSGNNYNEALMIPGDIICYNGHVAIYIGNGKIVHAANSRKGIIISNARHRDDILTVRRMISDSDSKSQSSQGTVGHGPMQLSAEDKAILERIVEAEAGDQGFTGKVYVANVILNRVVSPKFAYAKTVKDVVFAHNGSKYQFSPISNGRYYTVTVSEETRQAVRQAAACDDTSNGALYFMYRAASDPGNVTWFDKALTFLFKYKDHEFFR